LLVTEGVFEIGVGLGRFLSGYFTDKARELSFCVVHNRAKTIDSTDN
jgi:hypothetical protein